MKSISFSPIDITRKEINKVVKTLKSGWITTGAVTKEFEKKISGYCGTEKTVCLNSATASLDMILNLFEIGKGDEVITTSYTYVSTINSIIHTGAKVIFVDLKKDEFNIDPELIKKNISVKTKAIITTDIGGYPVDYHEIREAIKSKKKIFTPRKKTLQERLDAPLFISDAAHSFGAKYKNKIIGTQADFTFFSFHATKNISTGEGGAITFNKISSLETDFIYNRLMLLSLHGQSKDAYSKLTAGSWRYTIELPGYKCNLTDIASSIGITQLERYPEILKKRKVLFNVYMQYLSGDERFILPKGLDENKESSYHLFMLRINNCKESGRDRIISEMAKKKISLNVHFIPAVMQPYYKKIGFDIKNFPNTFNMYKNEISLPMSSKFDKNTAKIVTKELKKIL